MKTLSLSNRKQNIEISHIELLLGYITLHCLELCFCLSGLAIALNTTLQIAVAASIKPFDSRNVTSSYKSCSPCKRAKSYLPDNEHIELLSRQNHCTRYQVRRHSLAYRNLGLKTMQPPSAFTARAHNRNPQTRLE